MNITFKRTILTSKAWKLSTKIIFVIGIFSSAILLPKPGWTQKIDFEDVSVKYTLLPPVRLPADVASYRVVIAPAHAGLHLDIEFSDAMCSKIGLEGFKRSKDVADLEVALLLDEMKIPSIDPTSYVYYVWPARLKVTAYSGTNVIDTNITLKQQYTKFTPDPSKTRDQYAKEWESNKRLYFSMWEEILLSQYITIIDDLLKQQLSYMSLISSLKIGIPKNDRKSAFDYSLYQKAFDKIKAGLSNRVPDNVSTGSADIKEAIAIWEEELKEESPDKKDARIDKKVSYATHINCAVGYLWLFDFDKAEEHLNKADNLKSMFSGGDFKELRNTIQLMKKRYNLHPDWTGTRKTENRKSKDAFFDRDNLLARAKENNEWLKANPLPDPNKPKPDDPNIRLITANTWKYQKIVQVNPDGTSRVAYELNGADGTGPLSDKKVRYKFNNDGTYTYVDPSGNTLPNNKWWLKESNKIMIGWEISNILTLSTNAFTYKSGKEGGYQAVFYLIPE